MTAFAALRATAGVHYPWLDEPEAPASESVHDRVRPGSWDEFIGQERLVRRLRVAINAARRDGRPLRHVFLDGPGGTGKTTLASLIGVELDAPTVELSQPTSPLNVASALWKAEISDDQPGVLFIDEIHRWTRAERDGLLTLLEQQFIDTRYDRYQFTGLTVVAATTDRRTIQQTVLDRFPLMLTFDDYTDSEIARMAEGMAARLDVNLQPGVAATLAVAAAGVPRVARTLIEAARDLGDNATAGDILDFCDLHPDGLSGQHVRYLAMLADCGGVAGQELLSDRLYLDPRDLRRIERLLLDRRYIGRDRTGRVLTAAGRRRLQDAKEI